MSIFIPIWQEIVTHRRYHLDAATLALVGNVNSNLAQKFSFDSKNDQWQFNKDGINPQGKANSLPALRSQLGGGGKKDTSLYSVNLPTNGQNGITYYDGDTQLSFTLSPEFKVGKGIEQNGRLIYTFEDGGRLVYTAKNNGMKEDIVLPHDIADSLQFNYRLNLPNTLQAKILDDGSVGIFSADPALFSSNMSFGNDSDKAKVESARTTAAKDHLLFAIPAPIIKQTGTGNNAASAAFTLDGNALSLMVHGLDKLTYPVAIDPSVVITSSSDFSKGNNEGNIDYPANQINRGGLTGGSASSAWTAGTTFTTGRFGHQTVAYNGYLYILGGFDGGSTYLNDVQYAQLNTGNGSIGSWASTTSFTTGRQFHTAVAYDGYMYVMAGWNGTTYYNDVQYAPINANGTLGTWQTTTSVPTLRRGQTTVTYNGYMYVIGGLSSTGTYLNDVQYAPINANGTLGTWASTSTFTTGRDNHTSIIANGFVYIIGGYTGSYVSDVQYAPINANGTLGTWATTTSLPILLANHATTVNNGYVYVTGGTSDGSTILKSVYYAPINANGSVGTWTQTGDILNTRYMHAMTMYNGYLYLTGGNGASFYNDSMYVKIDAAGVTASYTNTNTYGTARTGVVSVAYNGFLYILGGQTTSSSGWSTTVNYVALNSNGTVGTWSTTTSFTTARSNFYAVAHNGFMYVCGGNTGTGTWTNTCYYSAIAGAGTLGTWTATSNFINARQGFGGAIYAGYMYIAGGLGSAEYNDVQYAPINASGTLGAWHYTHNSTDDSTTFVAGFTNIRESLGVVASGGYLYIVGGWQNSGGAGTYYNDVQYASLNANGTVGTWATTNSFTTARKDFGVTVINGYLYIASGQGSGGFLGDVQYAPINANGTVGTWATTTSVGTNRIDFGITFYRGYLYISGGLNSSSTALNDVTFAQVNNGGAGTAGAWTASSNLNAGRAKEGVAVYNGYLYVAGGLDSGLGAYLSSIEYAPLNANGTIGTWVTDTHAFTNARQNPGTVIYNGYMYIVGGWNGNGPVFYNDVQYAPVGTSGALTGNFSSTNNFDTAGRDAIGLQAYNGYLYVSGGWDNTVDHSDTRYAPINANGTVGTWADSGNNFTTARSDGETLINNGYLYYLGGNGTATYNDVQYAPINANGTLGAWKTTNSFNGIRQDFAVGVENGYMYIMGGDSGNGTVTPVADVQYAPINANGSVGRWTHTTPLPATRSSVGGVIYKGYAYVVAGYVGTSGSATTAYAPVSAISRKGTYSQQMDYGSQYALSNITYNGTLPGSLGSISVKQASATGVYGAATLASNLAVTAACTAGTTRYVLMTITLDDSKTASFPDSVGNIANVTDVTVNYVVKHPDPSIRLRGGKYFAQEILQPLDTCGF